MDIKAMIESDEFRKSVEILEKLTPEQQLQLTLIALARGRRMIQVLAGAALADSKEEKH